jgi:Protein of unknown function (DUF3810)
MAQEVCPNFAAEDILKRIMQKPMAKIKTGRPKHWTRKLKIWFTLLICVVFIKVFAINNFHVEHFYSTGFYPCFSRFLRILFGWIPFSFGDVLYLLAGIWLLWKVVKNSSLLFQKKLTRPLLYYKMGKLALIIGSVYIIFNLEWGLNYNRKGIAWQLHLDTEPYDTSDLQMIQNLLLQKVNETKSILIREQVNYPSTHELFSRAEKCYRKTSHIFPFLDYRNFSVKPTLYGKLGDYLGFTGYYNPFTGEAQVNTTVPDFLRPYITLHEMGHQLGYAKEDEANFSGYLAAANGRDTLFQYSAYLDLFIYANHELYFFDSTSAKNYAEKLIPPVRSDILEWREFDTKYSSFLEPAVNWIYGKYLEENQQPKGLRTYNAVIEMLIAYYKKYKTI